MPRLLLLQIDSMNQEHQEETPLVIRIKGERESNDRGKRAKLLDELLDQTGYGCFHVILLIGMYM